MQTVLTEEQRATVLANLALVEHIVNRVSASLPARHSRDDLVQTGILGLISATVRFDPGHGTAFSTFAGRRIEGAIIDMLRQHDWAPRSVRTAERRLRSSAATRGADEGAAVSVDQLADELGISPAEVERIRADIHRARIDSLDRPVNSEDTAIPLAATLFDPASMVEDSVDDQELIGYLRNGVSLLPERHRIVVIGFFFEGRSMTELGELLGVTQSRASQLKDEAIRMLRSGLDEVYRDRPAADGQKVTGRQRDFNTALASSRSMRDRLAAGRGYAAIGTGPDRLDVRT